MPSSSKAIMVISWIWSPRHEKLIAQLENIQKVPLGRVAVNLLSLAGLQCTGGAADFLDASTQHLEVVLVQQC